MNMRSQDSHFSDQDLLLAADGELSEKKSAEVQAHLASCWTCRTRMNEIESAIGDFVHVREAAALQLPPADGPRALLKLRMAEMAAAPRADRRVLALAAVGVFAVAIGIVALRYGPAPDLEVRAIPDPRITPGATLPVTREDICGEGVVEGVRIVPAAVAMKVFAAYGIDAPQPRAYEVDYLITPALGGSDHMRNFWPQPYGNTVWNAHAKDALEDHLHGLVCGGKVDLATAQQDIARDWIAAYKKYFRTEKPLPEHVSFLKDRPWE
jgi:hypothetical protein